MWQAGRKKHGSRNQKGQSQPLTWHDQIETNIKHETFLAVQLLAVFSKFCENFSTADYSLKAHEGIRVGSLVTNFGMNWKKDGNWKWLPLAYMKLHKILEGVS